MLINNWKRQKKKKRKHNIRYDLFGKYDSLDISTHSIHKNDTILKIIIY